MAPPRPGKNLLDGADLSDIHVPADITELAQRSVLASQVTKSAATPQTIPERRATARAWFYAFKCWVSNPIMFDPPWTWEPK